MANIQLTRFDSIFNNRESLLNALSNISRIYAENVAARYVGKDGDIKIMIVIFKSEELGDYEITFDSGNLPTSTRIFKVRKISNEQTDEDAISSALFGETPKVGDIVIINPYIGNYVTSYIFYNGIWELISGSFEQNDNGINVKDTNTISMNITTDETGVGVISSDVKLDNSTLTYDPETDSIRVNRIYGGTY